MARAWPRSLWCPARSRAIHNVGAAVLKQAAQHRDACLEAGRRISRRPRWLLSVLLVFAPLLAPLPSMAHDASAYGGMFRSRSMGASWLNADVGLFLSAALTVSVDPHDPNHLLMGSDGGLLASVNGGRSWTQEAPTLISGAVFAVAFSPDGATMMCATPGGVYRNMDGNWRRSDAPTGTTPGRAIMFGAAPGQVYLLGRDRLFSSNDGGARFVPVPGDGDSGSNLESIAILRQPSETLFAIAHGRLMVSADGGQRWQQRPVADTVEPIETVIPDPVVTGRIWVAAANRLHISDDDGLNWRMVGSALPESHTVVRGIAADPDATTVVVATHRGTYRSTDGGGHWMLEEGNLPVHLEAGPLARDPVNPGILYVVYSLIPYPEVWRNALEGSNLLARTDPISLIGGLAFLLLLLLSGIILVAWLTRWRRHMAGAAR